jgi:hypothetical protein
MFFKLLIREILQLHFMEQEKLGHLFPERDMGNQKRK